MKGKARNWSITINNPTEEELAAWKTATVDHHWVKATSGQLERGESGTIHLQGLLKTVPVPFSRVKKLLPRAHIEAARNVAALEKYVGKPETRVAALGEQRSSILTLTPVVLHDQLTSTLYDRLHHKGIPLVWRQRLVVIGLTESTEWVNDFWNDLDDIEDEPDMEMLIHLNRRYIHAHATSIIDEAISELIRQGIYGAEYATANVAARSALTRYLPYIIIRNVRRQEAQRQEADRIARETQARAEAPFTEVD